jgi:predicted anti-sigma-YlaC factor YlaD
MSGEELSCQEVVEILNDYLEGAMPAADRARIEQHLAECEGCDNYLEQLRTTIRLTGSLTEQSIPPGVMASLLRVFRAGR